jgi:hypothetical protein
VLVYVVSSIKQTVCCACQPLGSWPHDGNWQTYNQYWDCCFSLDRNSECCGLVRPQRSGSAGTSGGVGLVPSSPRTSGGTNAGDPKQDLRRSGSGEATGGSGSINDSCPASSGAINGSGTGGGVAGILKSWM